MGRKILKTAKDFQTEDIQEGAVLPASGEDVKVMNTNYKNSFGSFILCESLKTDSEPGNIIERGKEAHSDHRYEIKGVIGIPGYPEEQSGVGFFLQDKTSKTIKGFSVQETWEMVFQQGSDNVVAYKEKKTESQQLVMDTVDGLPGLESEYWKIPAYQTKDELFAPLSSAAAIELKRGLRQASRNLAKAAVSSIVIETNVDQEELYAVKEEINQAKAAAVLTGAGISTMSGIPDYRSVALGMWQKNPQLLEYLNEVTFQDDPALFWKNFYLLLRNTLQPVMPFPNHPSLIAAIEAITPNQAHQFFSWLENEQGKEIAIITQNVDRLHQKAGNKTVVEFHGNVLECSCRNCGRTYDLAEVISEKEAPVCVECGSILRPDAVFFGDPVKGLEEAINVLKHADLVVVAGTSLQVYPFSSLVNHVENDVNLIYLNGEAPDNPELFDFTLTGNLSVITEELQKLLEANE